MYLADDGCKIEIIKRDHLPAIERPHQNRRLRKSLQHGLQLGRTRGGIIGA